MIGANQEAIRKAEDRELFKKAMHRIGLEVPRSGFAHNLQEAREIVKEIGLPAVIRPSFTLGGTGGGIAFNIKEYEELAEQGIELSMIHEIMIEESVSGLEGIRTRSHARPEGQCGHHLLHREF